MTWAAFEQYALDRYKAYLYLTVTHGLNVPILQALGRTDAFRRERFFLDAFIHELDTFLRENGWDGGVDDSDPEVGIFFGLAWNGYYDRGNYTVEIKEGKDLVVELSEDYQSKTVYRWKWGYHITRNDMPIIRDQLLEMVAVDLKV